tara:strand:- start:149 stop:2296 length:2148 start_codon:yes stop_codon:yes gene_type:complete
MGQMGGQPPQPSPQQPQSLNMNVSPESRAKFAGFLEGVRSKSATPPMQPPMMPQQPPMMPPMPMNMGGMVDVFDPRYMNEGGFVFTTGEGGKINTTPVVDENTGRVVSKILSNQAMEDMAKATEGLEEPEISLSQQIQNKVIENAMKADESERDIPFAQTVIESDTSDIAIPVQKPKIQLPVSKPEFSDIEVPVSKPSVASILTDIDDLGTEERMIKDIDDLGTENRTIKDIDDLGTESRGVDTGGFNAYSGGAERQALMDKPVEGVYDEATGEYTFKPIDVIDPFILERELAKRRLSPEGMEQIARMVTEGEKLSGPEVDVFDMLNISPIGETYGEEMGEAETGTVGIYPETPKKDLTIDDIAKLIMASQTPLVSSGEEDKKESRLMNFLKYGIRGIRNKNEGGIVQGFRNGGFTTNLRARESTPKEQETAKDVEKAIAIASSPRGQRFDDYGAYDKVLATGAGSKYGSGYGTNLQTELDRSAKLREPDELRISEDEQVFSPVGSNFSDFMSGDVNPISKDVSGYYRPADAPAPPEEYFDEGFMKSQKSMFAPFVNKLGGIMGYDNPYDLYKATQATLADDSMQSSIARDRLKDQESAERKLAEEQRLRAMIQSMMPPAPETTTTPTAPIAEAPAVATLVNPQDVIVPSDRAPNFSIPPLPVLPSTSPLLPQGISPELLRNLFKLQGVPATAMNQGGSVNTLDSAIDNFLSSVR